MLTLLLDGMPTTVPFGTCLLYHLSKQALGLQLDTGPSGIVAAAANNDLAEVMAELARGHSINTRQSWNWRHMWQEGDSGGPAIKKDKYRGVSALVVAISMRNNDMVEFLLHEEGIECSKGSLSCDLPFGGYARLGDLCDTSEYHG